jgi:ATP-dependent protease Clp ATPase subunit
VSEPTAILLIGITGSGKTHLAQALAESGLIRLASSMSSALAG